MAGDRDRVEPMTPNAPELVSSISTKSLGGARDSDAGEVRSSVMPDVTPIDARSPPHRSLTETRASKASDKCTAEPPLASGFGLIIDKEHALRTSLADWAGRIGGNRAADVEGILRQQQYQMDATIALLEQRYEGFSTGEHAAKTDNVRRSATSAPTSYEAGDVLRDLGGQHASLLVDIDALLERAPDGQRGELILAEVKRNHEEMAWVLTASLREDATAEKLTEKNHARVAGATSWAQENRDNEGGPTRPCSPHQSS